MSTISASKYPTAPTPLLSPERLNTIWNVIKIFEAQHKREEEKINQEFS